MKYLLTFLLSLSLVIISTGFVSADANNPQDNFSQGNNLSVNYNHIKSISMYQKVLEINSSELDATYQQAVTLVNSGSYSDAMPLIDKVLQQRPNDTNALYEKALILDQQFNFTQEIHVYNKLLEIDPRNTTALNNEALVLDLAGNYTEAAQLYDKISQISPNEENKTDALINEANELLYAGKYNDAIAAANIAIILDPKRPEPWYAKLLAQSNLGKPDLTLQSFKAMVERNSTDLKGLEYVREKLDEYQRYKQEIKILEQILNLNQNDPDAYANTLSMEGKIYERLGDYNSAYDIFNQILTIKHNDTDTLLNLGHVYVKLDLYDNATNDLAEYLQLTNETTSSPEDYVRAYYDYGSALFGLGEYENATQQYDNALEQYYVRFTQLDNQNALITLAEKESEAIDKLGEHERLVENAFQFEDHAAYSYSDVQTNYYKGAIVYYDHFLQFQPKNVTILEEEAKIFNYLGNPSMTIITADKILDIMPHDALALGLKGDSFLSMKKYDEAEKYYNQALEIDPTDVYSLVGEGDGFVAKKNEDTAVKKYILVTSQNPEPDDTFAWDEIHTAHLRLASAYIDLGKFADATKELTLLLLNTPNDTEVLDTQGDYFLKQNNFAEAQTWYDKSLHIDPYDSTALNHKALCLFYQGNYTGASQFYEDAVLSDSDNDAILANEAELLNKQSNFISALDIAFKAQENNPTNSFALVQVGNAYFGLGNYVEAQTWYDKALNADLENEYAFKGKGETLLQMGSYSESIPYFDHAIAILSKNNKIHGVGLNPDEKELNQTTWHAKTVALIDIGNQELDQQPSDALENFEKALNIEPQNEAALKGKEDASKAVSNNIFWQNVNQFSIIIGVLASAAAIVPFIHLHKKRKQRIKNQKSNPKFTSLGFR